LAHWLAGHAANSSSEDEPGHEHHSLSQLLAGGLLEQTLDFPALEQTVVFIAIPVLLSNDPLLEENWDAQSASRGPPFRRG
jgi:hypothetical protein